MHELGIVFEVLDRVKNIAAENKLSPEEIAAVVLDVGEASLVVPKYLRNCWPAAIDRTEYEHVELKINEVVAVVECKQCGNFYEFLKNERKCPVCGCEEAVIVTGKEFLLKEILLYGEE
ncbi:hydrogenase maturation nickel metallochaperone HypA [Emergencia timonensis]|uniref:hydrogenase maturation nickel metallochaperone HypA n=1 Tax=Emergencia timonensis TaxID=1776384 RepID=UPI0039966293